MPRKKVKSRPRGRSHQQGAPGRWLVERWPVSRLREHPLQRKLFFDLSDSAIAVADGELQNDKVHPPVHALPDGTVIRGCGWFRAAVAERRKQISVIVRHDLTQAGPAAAVKELIQHNLRSRQVSDLEQAACYLAYSRTARHCFREAAGDSRDRIAKELGLRLSGRSLDRIARLLKLPVEVREAIAARKITQRLGEQILALSPEQQEAIALDLAAGNSASEIIDKYRHEKVIRRSPQAEFDRLVARLRQVLPRLHGHDESLVPANETAHQVVLDAADLLLRIGRRHPRQIAALSRSMPSLPPNVGIRTMSPLLSGSPASPDKMTGTYKRSSKRSEALQANEIQPRYDATD